MNPRLAFALLRDDPYASRRRGQVVLSKVGPLLHRTTLPTLSRPEEER